MWTSLAIKCLSFALAMNLVITQEKQASSAIAFTNGESFPGCGIESTSRHRRHISEFIIGGNDGIEKAHPWHAALLDHERGYYCAGTLISRTAVLTGATCLLFSENDEIKPYSEIEVVFGERDLNEIIESRLANQQNDVQSLRPARLLPHPNYKKNYFQHDIGLVIFEDPGVTITPFVRPICLWKDGYDFQKVKNKIGEVVGWGFIENHTLSDILQVARMRVIPHEECFRMDRLFFSRYLMPGQNFCAGGRGKTACIGDSGGGFAIALGRKWYLRGIVSFGKTEKDFTHRWAQSVCPGKIPSLYTDVTYYMDWIRLNSKI